VNNQQTSTAQRLEPRFGPARELDRTEANVRDVDVALPAPNMGLVEKLGELEVNGMGDPGKHLELDSVKVLGQWQPKLVSATLTHYGDFVYGYGKAYSGAGALRAIVPGELGDEVALNTTE